MKYILLILVCSFLTVFAYADEDAVNPNDPNLKEGYSPQAAFVDRENSSTTSQRDFFKVEAPGFCPACSNLTGGLDNLVDESGNPIVASDGSKIKTGTGVGSGTLGQ
jgi:hypothetical protein